MGIVELHAGYAWISALIIFPVHLCTNYHWGMRSANYSYGLLRMWPILIAHWDYCGRRNLTFWIRFELWLDDLKCRGARRRHGAGCFHCRGFVRGRRGRPCFRDLCVWPLLTLHLRRVCGLVSCHGYAWCTVEIRRTLFATTSGVVQDLARTDQFPMAHLFHQSGTVLEHGRDDSLVARIVARFVRTFAARLHHVPPAFASLSLLCPRACSTLTWFCARANPSLQKLYWITRI